jgi:hypothetical protein
MTLKATFMCSKNYRTQFPDPTAQLTISVGQSMHEGERLIATVSLVNKAFSHCTIMIDDSIQWHTLSLADPQAAPDALIEAAIAAGDDYLARNKATFARYFTIPYRIIRWRDWHGSLKWQLAIQNMQTAYDSNTVLKQAIDNNVQTFLARYEKNQAGDKYDRAHAVKMCTKYLIEECAVMETFWVELGCHYEVYPCGRNEAMSATHQLFIAPYHHLLLPISLRFNRLKSKTRMEA